MQRNSLSPHIPHLHRIIATLLLARQVLFWVMSELILLHHDFSLDTMPKLTLEGYTIFTADLTGLRDL